jgi:hypothetical protein
MLVSSNMKWLNILFFSPIQLFIPLRFNNHDRNESLILLHRYRMELWTRTLHWICGLDLWTGSNCGYIHNWTNYSSGSSNYHRNSEEPSLFRWKNANANAKSKRHILMHVSYRCRKPSTLWNPSSACGHRGRGDGIGLHRR